MVFLPQNSVIAAEKLKDYLLVQQPKDDKSKFLSRAGYTLDNWEDLEQDLRTQVLTQPAEFAERTRFGNKYIIRAKMKGRNSVTISVLTVWIEKAGITRFVTLVPDRGEHT